MVATVVSAPYVDFAQHAASVYGLSGAETGVLSLVAQGCTRAQISEELFIAPVTVRVHISRICKKLGLSGAEELEAYCKHHTGPVSSQSQDTAAF